jgi:hypothetical protein
MGHFSLLNKVIIVSQKIIDYLRVQAATIKGWSIRSHLHSMEISQETTMIASFEGMMLSSDLQDFRIVHRPYPPLPLRVSM